MSREIKFRAWNGDQMLLSDRFGIPLMFDMAADIGGGPLPIMQFTELLDVNGVEIYEGDIVRCKDRNLLWVVSFYKSCFIAHDPENKYDFVLITDYTFAVIGNIHQNLELLK